MDFQKATESDIEEIYSLVKNAIAVMDQNGIPQWDEIYPTKEDFLNDIRAQNLYKGIIDRQIAVIYALNKYQDEAYLFHCSFGKLFLHDIFEKSQRFLKGHLCRIQSPENLDRFN